jgi:hypothetical protein
MIWFVNKIWLFLPLSVHEKVYDLRIEFCKHNDLWKIFWKVAGSIPDKVTGFLNWPNPSSHTVSLGLTQPLTEMSTRNLPQGKVWPAHKADNFTAICEPNV